jgi:hypothetical protein
VSILLICKTVSFIEDQTTKIKVREVVRKTLLLSLRTSYTVK